MRSILFIYGKEHPDLRYRQGMHELLSSLLLLRMGKMVEFSKAFLKMEFQMKSPVVKKLSKVRQSRPR